MCTCEKICWAVVGGLFGIAIGYHLNNIIEEKIEFDYLVNDIKKKMEETEDDGEMIDPEIDTDLDNSESSEPIQTQEEETKTEISDFQEPPSKIINEEEVTE